MNAQELKESLNFYVDNFDDISVSVYAILKDTDSSVLKVDVERDALKGLKTLFMDSLKNRILDNEELVVLNLSTADERMDAIYVYDLDFPNELETLNLIRESDSFTLLDLNTASLSNIKSILIEIGNNEQQLILYKTMASINIFGRANFFLRKHQHRLEQIEDEFLRMSDGFQLLSVSDELLVMDIGAIEKQFGFHDVIKREAALGIQAIESILLIENPAVLHELIDDVKYARRFTKVAKASPVLKANIPNSSIIDFCKRFPNLKGRIRFNDAEDKIVLDTKVSKDLFIKVLMDDFLTSELTAFHYASVAKDAIETTQELGSSE